MAEEIMEGMKVWYTEGLNLFVDKIDEALQNKGDTAEFRTVLTWAVGPFGISMTQIQDGVGVSKAAISKWINGKAETTAPTQTAILQWLRAKIIEQVEKLDRPLADAPAF